MKKYTPLLFLASAVLSAASYILISKGHSEIYPFYSWKLFSKPFGATASDSVYSIYGIKDNDTVLISNADEKVYDGNTKFAIINLYGNKIEKGNDQFNSKQKLRRFAELTAPGFSRYLLVKEIFNPQLIGTKDFTKTITIITTF